MLTMPCSSMDINTKSIVFIKATDPNITLYYNQICAYHKKDVDIKDSIGDVTYTKDYNNIDYLWVKPEERHCGIGAELFIRALEDCHKNGNPCISWYALTSTPYYLQFGARITKQTKYEAIKSSGNMEFDFTKDGNPRINRFNNKNER